MEKFYITTTLPYVNAPPHIGFALEIIQADVIARFYKLLGKDVVFNTGTDEHGLKVYRAAQDEGKDPQQYVDQYAAKFENLKSALNVSYTNFIRTTDKHHIEAAQEFWKRCDQNGDIEKKTYSVKYCVGCELEKTDSELEDGRCVLHPNLKLETREEENYFFKFSRYQDKLLELYRKNPEFVVPDFRFNEIKRFVEEGLNDFSISRLKEKMPWGVPVPGDDAHVMYVWFDALVNYISTLGWPFGKAQDKPFDFEAWWGTTESPNAVQIAGKDNLRQQSAMWQAMLFSAGIAPSKQILIHGFITSEGKKISKSLGNTVDPFEVVKKYGTDPTRYYLLREIPSHGDGDFSVTRFEERYNADLANGLGNFAARVLTLAEKHKKLNTGHALNPDIAAKIELTRKEVFKNIEHFRLHEALAKLWRLITFGDEYINLKKPWATSDHAALLDLVVLLDNIAAMLKPFLPETSEKITRCIVWEKDALRVKKSETLFPRLLNPKS